MRVASRLVVGALAGLVATMAMTATVRRLHGKLPAKERYPAPPREFVDSALSPRAAAAPDLTLVAHFAYGAGCGAVLATLNPRIGRAAGALAGGAIWLTSYMGWIPALGVLEPATRHPLRRNAVMIAAHLSWGWSTAAAIRELGAARQGLFAAGPAEDAPSRRAG